MGREFVVLFDNKMGNNSSASSEEGNDQSAMDRDTKVKHETSLETKQDNNETDKSTAEETAQKGQQEILQEEEIVKQFVREIFENNNNNSVY